MIICVCHNVSDKKLNKIIEDKPIVSIKQLQKEVDICNQCKICACDLNNLIKKQNQQKVTKEIELTLIPIVLEQQFLSK